MPSPSSSMPIGPPRLAMVQPEPPAHVVEINTLQSRLLLAWGRLSMPDRVRVVEDVERLTK